MAHVLRIFIRDFVDGVEWAMGLWGGEGLWFVGGCM